MRFHASGLFFYHHHPPYLITKNRIHVHNHFLHPRIYNPILQRNVFGNRWPLQPFVLPKQPPAPPPVNHYLAGPVIQTI